MLNSKWRALYEHLQRRSRLFSRVSHRVTNAASFVDSGMALAVTAAKALSCRDALLRPAPLLVAPGRQEPMRVLFMTFEGAAVAPARVRCYRFAEELRRRGHVAEVFSFWHDIWGIEGLPARPYATTERYLAAFQAYEKLRGQRFDIIYQQRPNYDLLTAALLQRTWGCRVVFDIDDWIFRYGILHPFRLHHVLPHLRRLSDTCVVSSQLLRTALEPSFDKVFLVPTFVDSDVFRPRACRSDGPIVFGWNGTVFQHYMVDSVKILIEAFALAHREIGSRAQVKLELLAQGSYFPALEQWFRTAHPGLPIVTRNWLDPGKMNDYLDGIDVGLYALALPRLDPNATRATRCLPYLEQTAFLRAKSPTKIFEYMAKGIPVLSTTAGEASAFVEHGQTGLLGDSPGQLAQAMVQLALDPGLRERMGTAGRAKVEEHYSLWHAGAQLESILRGLLAPRAPGAMPVADS